MKTRVLIIGGGVTGTGLARDLALRGIPCVLVEQRDIDAGASGGNHGLLHSGGRYVASDAEAARECRDEGNLLKRLAPHCIEETQGLFVAVPGDDETYIADFPDLCTRSGIPAEPVDPNTALEWEPALSPNLIAAYAVEDASVDPFKLALDNIADACRLGAVFLPHTQAVSFESEKKRVRSVRLRNRLTGETLRVEADQVVNAAGAWAGRVAHRAGLHLNVVCSKGTLLITQSRITRRVINRLRKPGDGDILVPGGTVSILGTTSVRVDTPEGCRPTVPEVDRIIEEGAAMVPVLADTRYIRAYAGVRPLIGSSGGDDRKVSRGFALLDHSAEGLENFTTIAGGKLTTYRLMAEKTADLVCKKLQVSKPCRTRTEPLPPSDTGRWTQPGLAPREWLRSGRSDDLLLCECEMVSRDVVDRIIQSLQDQGGQPTLRSVGLRSRIGKGPCQGGFCSARIAAYMYDIGAVTGHSGLKGLRDFLRERWRGKRPVLWDLPMEQAELQEALHCGLFGLEQ